VTPGGKTPTIDDAAALNDPSRWYTGPTGTLSHLSGYALVSTGRADARAGFRRHRGVPPEGASTRAFGVAVEEIINADEGLEDE
jgi:hypothetical protein